jgi:hypothetical protein
MGTDSKENCLLETAVSSLLVSAVSEKRQAFRGSPQGESALLRLAELAEEFDAQQVAADARSVAERVSEGRFYVARIGQFKRGKYSVLNDLVGDILCRAVFGSSDESKIAWLVRHFGVCFMAASG